MIIEQHDLARLIGDALEQLAFVIVDVEDDDTPADHQAFYARLRTGTDAWTGYLTISVDEELAAEVASGLLGIDESEIEAHTHADDVACELANIIAGSVTLSLGGDKESIAMGIPEPLASRPHELDDPNAVTVHLVSDTGTLIAAWTTEPVGINSKPGEQAA